MTAADREPAIIDHITAFSVFFFRKITEMHHHLSELHILAALNICEFHGNMSNDGRLVVKFELFFNPASQDFEEF